MHQIMLENDPRPLAALGQGTWLIGDEFKHAAREMAALQAGIDHGLQVIDTAAMYANGGSEQLVGQVTRHQRENVYLISKVWPIRADYHGVPSSLEGSLNRLQTSYLNLLLLH